MGEDNPFVLLDDARDSGAVAARLYTRPIATFVANRPDEVERVLNEAHNALEQQSGELAGYIGYEAGLALEPKLAPLAEERAGATGPLVWLGLFDQVDQLQPEQMTVWLAAQSEQNGSIGPLAPQVSVGGYQRAFNSLQEAIHAGDIYQANLTYPLAGSYRGHPLALYRQLRAGANAGYGGLLFDGSHWLLSFSPELFVALDGRDAKVKPMKGTRPRSQDSSEDQALAEDLAKSAKDKAENLMIVDLMRNDLSRISKPGSVRVERPFAIESYPTVHQMVSTVRATLKADASTSDLIRALFPCGSITGAPKIRAMELINQVERNARGAYCGAIGRIGANGDAAFNVAIRTLRLTPVENGQGMAVLGVGSAIVADSDAIAERRECEVKAGFVRQSSSDLNAPHFDLIETMRFEPETGIARLERHLERLKSSARTLGFEFDRHQARNQIQALSFDLEAPSKIRLLLARSGAISLETGPIPEVSDRAIECIALPLPVDPSDWRLSHKSSDREFYEQALLAAKAVGAGEALLVRDDGFITEGSFTNIFVKDEHGRLLTPAASLGLLPGVLRAELIANGDAVEAQLSLVDLEEGFWLGNALRGLFPAKFV